MRQTGIVLGMLRRASASFAGDDWLEASGDRFVIHSDQNEAALRRFAERLADEGHIAAAQAQP
jgi:hypothetical protein